MQNEGIDPDAVTFICILKACGMVGSLEIGDNIGVKVREKGFLQKDIMLGNALVDMYFKCGAIEKAQEVFEQLPVRDVVSWNAMISGYAELGFSKLALQCYEDMLNEGISPDSWTFSSLFSACSEAALVEEGYCYFKSMIHDHGITPSIEHFNSMIDLLGRAGHLLEARKVPQTMPFRPDITTWMSLLTGCRMYGNVELGKQCLHEISQLEPDSASVYTMLSNIFGEFGMLEDVKNVQGLKKYASAWKKPGRACIEVGHMMQEFVVGESISLGSNDMYHKFQRLARKLKEEGYSPKLELIFESMESQL